MVTPDGRPEQGRHKAKGEGSMGTHGLRNGLAAAAASVEMDMKSPLHTLRHAPHPVCAEEEVLHVGHVLAWMK